MLPLLALVSSVASAAEVPQWNLPTDKPMLYHIELRVVTPRGYRYYARNNVDALAADIRIVADTTCNAAPLGKQNWEVTCTFAYLKMTGSAFSGSDDIKLRTVLEEWSTRMAGSTVSFVEGRDGKQKELDVKGVVSADARDSSILDSQRVLFQRMFALFDLKLPKADDADTWKRGWEEKGLPATMQLQTSSGTVGAARVAYTPKGQSNGLFDIVTSGKALVTAGSTLDVESGSYNVELHVAGLTQFDMKAGTVAWRDLSLEGFRTVSSNDVGNDAEFAMTMGMQLVDAFGANGAAPPPTTALRSGLLDAPPPTLEDGVPLVAFKDLGLPALFIPQMPAEAKAVGIPTSTVSARVLVDATGKVTSATVYKGFGLLAPHAEQALRAARFPVRDAKPYAVDVDVEFRTE